MSVAATGSAYPDPYALYVVVPLAGAPVYAGLLNAACSNVRFFQDAALTQPLVAYQDFHSEPAYWVKLPFSIPASGTVPLYMAILSQSSTWDGYYLGVAADQTSVYAQYDNGAVVFPGYDNFSGSSLASWWSAVSGGPSSTTVNDGLSIVGNGSSWTGYQNTAPNFAVSTGAGNTSIVEGKFAVTGVSGNAGAIAVNGS